MFGRLHELIKLQFVFPLALLVIAGVLMWKNYTPNTWLTGWDTLHPEMNFRVAFERVMNGLWRADQGVGAIAAHSHISELPRIFILWVSSAVLPVSFLRYFYIFLCLTLGPLGMYFFLKKAFSGKNDVENNILIFLASFLGASYYLFNLGTLQNFYVPFEMFPTQFACLPWILYFVLRILVNGKSKDCLGLTFVSLLASPQAYAAALFYAYFVCLAAFLVFYWVLSRFRRAVGKRAVLIIFFVFATNAYWMFPNFYSIRNQSRDITNAKINLLFSPEAFLRNKEYGDLGDVLTNKSFLFSWRAYDFQKGQFTDLLLSWKAHLSKPGVTQIMGFVAVISMCGAVISVIKRDKLGIALLVFMGIAMFFLINDNPPTGFIFEFLQRFSVFREGFRMPFTKFSMVFVASMAYYFGFFFSNLPRKIPFYIFSGLVFLGLLYFALPFFRGELISPKMRVNIPNEYGELFNYLNDHPEGRIAKMPLNTLWGWVYYSWGYQGAGFTWFGSKNSEFDRDFDRWSPYNESFYNEASNFYYNHDEVNFEKTLKKYRVKYILLDESVIDPGADSRLLDYADMHDFLSRQNHIRMVWKDNFLTLYQTDYGDQSISDGYTKTSSDAVYSQSDFIYSNYGNYVESGGGITHPFVNLEPRSGMNIQADDESVIIEKKFDGKVFESTQLSIPNYIEQEHNLPLSIYGRFVNANTYQVRLVLKIPDVDINGEKIYGGEYVWRSDRFNLGNNHVGFVRVYDQVFEIKDIKTEEQLLGSVIVPVDREIGVGVYGSDLLPMDSVVSDLLSENVRLCADYKKTFPLDETGNSFSLSVGGDSVCLGTDMPILEDSIINVYFEARSDEMAPQFCITRAGQEGCVNKGAKVDMVRWGDWKKLSYNIPVSAGNYWFDFVGQGQESGIKKIYYSNLIINRYPVIKQINFKVADSYSLVSTERNIPIDSGANDFKVVIPARGVTSEDFRQNRGNILPVNCDFEKVGTAYKNNFVDGVRYKATDGATSCDYYDFPQLRLDSAYVLRIRGQNIRGRGIKFYLQDKETGHFVLEELLPGGNFDANYFVPGLNRVGLGYVINLETRSFGKIPSENILTKIEFIPIPYFWISNLKVGEVAKIPSENVIVNGQGYEDGWQAIQIQNSSQFSGQADVRIQKLEHVKVNGWENGWIMNNSDLKSKGSEVIIFYWPQVLEWIGIVLTIFTLGSIIVVTSKEMNLLI
jgi:hypothetical protein